MCASFSATRPSSILYRTMTCFMKTPPQRLIDNDSARQIGDRPSHRAGPIGSHETGHLGELLQRGGAAPVRDAFHEGLKLLTADAVRLGMQVEHDFDRRRLRDPRRSQANRADPMRPEF